MVKGGARVAAETTGQRTPGVPLRMVDDGRRGSGDGDDFPDSAATDRPVRARQSLSRVNRSSLRDAQPPQVPASGAGLPRLTAFRLDMLVFFEDVHDPKTSSHVLKNSRAQLRLRWGFDPLRALSKDMQNEFLDRTCCL